jgi:hypothetical protein
MIIVLLHLIRLLPLLCGGHRQVALENLALRQQLAVYGVRRATPRFAGLFASSGSGWPGSGPAEAIPRDHDPRHRPALAAVPVSRALDQAVRAALRPVSVYQHRDQGPRHPNGRRQSAFWCPQNPWRTPEARHRCRRAHRLPAARQALDFSDLVTSYNGTDAIANWVLNADQRQQHDDQRRLRQHGLDLQLHAGRDHLKL